MTDKIGVDSITTPITKRKSSHKGAWARILILQLKQLGFTNCRILDKGDDWCDYDVIFLEHGMEFKGSFNVFGGANDDLADNINRLVTAVNRNLQPVRLVSCDVPMPDVAGWVQSRKSTCSEKFAALDVDEIRFCQGQARYYERPYPSTGLVLGDSHSLSAWLPGWELLRLDGKTLYGALEHGIDSFLDDHHKQLTLYFGNIDIRHHLMRQSDPVTSTHGLVMKYIEQVYGLVASGRVDHVTIVKPLPIEDESRPLPKTGYYKGTPFYGTREQRDIIRQWFNHYLDESVKMLLEIQGRVQLVDWSPTLTDGTGKLRFDVMEAGKSVHLSPENYRTCLDTGSVRW